MTTVDTLVDSYLRRLDVAAARLPVDRREELLQEIREHIEGARAAGAAADEAAVCTLLDRLGEPEEIVASATDDVAGAPAAASSATRSPSTALETAAVLMLTLGSLVPVVGWLVGVVLLCSSRRWRPGEKVLGILVVPGGPGGLLVAGALLGGQTCSSSSSAPASPVPVPGTVGAPPLTGDLPLPPTYTSSESCTGGLPGPVWLPALLLVVSVVASITVAVVLLRRAKSRAALEPDRLVGPSPWGGLEVATVVLLGGGAFVLPVLGTIAGLVCLYSSVRWTPREKGVATLLALVLPAVGLVGLIIPLALFRS